MTGDWQTYTDVTLALDNPPTASGPLYFVARRPAGSVSVRLTVSPRVEQSMRHATTCCPSPT